MASLIACDAKIVRDDSADFRHDAEEFAVSRTLAARAMTKLEREAQALGFQLVETDGDVVLVTSGAGLGMMMMDLIGDHGMRAASFMDNLRGAPDETMTERLKIARALAARPNIKAIIFQTTLASRSLAERVEALVDMACRRTAAKAVIRRHCRRSRRDPQNDRGTGRREAASARRFRLHRSCCAGEGRREGRQTIICAGDSLRSPE